MPRPVHALTETAALAAFANPVRSRILDLLAVEGSVTASVVGVRLGVAVGSASHHLKVLHEAGLVEEVEGASEDRRQRHWRLTHAHTRWARSEMTDPTARSAAYEAELVNLARQHERAREALLASADDAAPPTGAFAAQQWLTLSAEELGELNDELLAVLHRWRHRELPDDGVERDVCFVFTRGFPSAP